MAFHSIINIARIDRIASKQGEGAVRRIVAITRAKISISIFCSHAPHIIELVLNAKSDRPAKAGGRVFVDVPGIALAVINDGAMSKATEGDAAGGKEQGVMGHNNAKPRPHRTLPVGAEPLDIGVLTVCRASI